jgi:putative transposase
VQQGVDRIRDRATNARQPRGGRDYRCVRCRVGGRKRNHARGSQYHSRSYRNALRRLEIGQSTSRTGSCLDGAAAESFFATIKAEIGVASWPDRTSARRDIENWIKTYNERRLHSTLDHRTPTETRRAWQERMVMAA